MAAALPQISDCCESVCQNTTTDIPGPAGPTGPAGTNGTDGTNGVSSFTTTGAATSMPASAATVVATVVTSAPFTVGENVFIQFLGYMAITAIGDGTHITVQNLGYPENSAPGTVAAIGALVVPSGARGAAGAAGAGGATGATGAAGAAGATGAAGSAGVNAYTALTSNFTMPAIAGSGTAVVGNSSWATVGQVVFLQGAGTLQVTAKPSSTQITLLNPSAYTANVAGGTVIASPATISPSGLIGPAAASPLTQFVSAQQTVPIADNNTVVVAHGLAGTPQWVEWVLVCTDAGGDLNYSLNDEVLLQSAGCSGTTDNVSRVPEARAAANLQLGAFLWLTTPLRLADKVSGVNSVLTTTKWKLKAYAAHY